MEVNNGYRVKQQQHHLDSRTLKFDFFNGVANFAVTTRK